MPLDEVVQKGRPKQYTDDEEFEEIMSKTKEKNEKQ